MEVRRFDAEKDHRDVCQWWTDQKWTPIPVPMLPKNGFVVEEGGTKLCAGWIYETDSKIAWCEWIVGNPSVDKERRREALDVLIERLIDHAKERKFGVLFTTVSHPGLVERYEKHGLVITDRQMTNMAGRLE